MHAHAVHSEGNQCEILVEPIESTVKMALRLEIAIVGTRHVVEEARRRESHKGDTMLVQRRPPDARPCEIHHRDRCAAQ